MNAQPQSQQSAWTVSRLLTWTMEHLAQRDVDEPRLAAEVLLAHAMKCRRIDLYVKFETVPEKDEMDQFRGWVKRAAGHEPIAYLVGEKEFFSLAFHVSSDVLIPRPETESLVELVIDHCTNKAIESPKLLDVGTGSGCITVALLTQLPKALAVASDISPEALAIAQQNATRHKVDDRTTFVEADGLDLPKSIVPDEGFDVIVSNPPYVSADDFQTLDSCVKDYEPRQALTDENDGLSYYTLLANDAPSMMAKGGWLVVEIGDGQREAATEAMLGTGNWHYKKTVRDQVGGVERVLAFELAKE
ncbi:peptide chain release factor N(5)-glutamine methyltransferase [bacterium AH-315-J04]|nr:peptide chain release factor N(5)-glutamine methyltransferase [bacterium AH-315-J04]